MPLIRSTCGLLVALVAFSSPARAQVCSGGVCVVNYEDPEQRTTFEMRNLRSEAIAITLWFEFLTGMDASAPVPLTAVLQPGERREVLTLVRTRPGVQGNYRFRFDFRPDPVDACLSPLACTWWERTAEATILRAVRKAPEPIALRLVQPGTDTLRLVLWNPGATDVLRLGPNAQRPAFRLLLLPTGSEAESRDDSLRVYALPYRGALRVQQIPAASVRLSGLAPPPPGIRAFSWEAPPGTPVYAVRAGMVTSVSSPRPGARPDTFRSANQMVVQYSAPSGYTVSVLHPDGTSVQYGGLGSVSAGLTPGTRVAAGVEVGTVAPGMNLILGTQRPGATGTEALVPRFRTHLGDVYVQVGEVYRPPQ